MYTDFINEEDDFVEDAIAALPDYLNKENTRNLLTIHLERLKEIEVALVDLAEGRLLENAEGFILDEVGEQLNKPRNGLNDASYRSSLNIVEGIKYAREYLYQMYKQFYKIYLHLHKHD